MEKVVWRDCGFAYSYEESKGEKEDTPMDYTRNSGPNESEELFLTNSGVAKPGPGRA